MADDFTKLTSVELLVRIDASDEQSVNFEVLTLVNNSWAPHAFLAVSATTNIRHARPARMRALRISAAAQRETAESFCWRRWHGGRTRPSSTVQLACLQAGYLGLLSF